jgi:hypothetical protein
VLPLVDQYRSRLRERAAGIRLYNGELCVVVEVVARGGALARGRGLPDRSSAVQGDRHGDLGCRLQVVVQLVIDDAAAVVRTGWHESQATEARRLTLQILGHLRYKISPCLAPIPHSRLRLPIRSCDRRGLADFRSSSVLIDPGAFGWRLALGGSLG